MESNKGSCRSRHTYTTKFQQRYALRVSLCPKATGKATSKGENRDTKEKRISHRSQQRCPQRAKRRITHQPKEESSTWFKVRKPRVLRKAKHLQKSRLVLPIGRRAREHHTENSRSSTSGSSSISIYNTTESRRPKGPYAQSSTKRAEDGRQQVISQTRGGILQQGGTQGKITSPSQQSSVQKW
jgi:hypothetical protein